MVYQYPYNIFDRSTLEAQYARNQALEEQRYHFEQQDNILKMVKALSDYFEAARKVSPDYRSYATELCLAELFRQANIDGIFRSGI